MCEFSVKMSGNPACSLEKPVISCEVQAVLSNENGISVKLRRNSSPNPQPISILHQFADVCVDVASRKDIACHTSNEHCEDDSVDHNVAGSSPKRKCKRTHQMKSISKESICDIQRRNGLISHISSLNIPTKNKHLLLTYMDILVELKFNFTSLRALSQIRDFDLLGKRLVWVANHKQLFLRDTGFKVGSLFSTREGYVEKTKYLEKLLDMGIDGYSASMILRWGDVSKKMDVVNDFLELGFSSLVIAYILQYGDPVEKLKFSRTLYSYGVQPMSIGFILNASEIKSKMSAAFFFNKLGVEGKDLGNILQGGELDFKIKYAYELIGFKLSGSDIGSILALSNVDERMNHVRLLVGMGISSNRFVVILLDAMFLMKLKYATNLYTQGFRNNSIQTLFLASNFQEVYLSLMTLQSFLLSQQAINSIFSDDSWKLKIQEVSILKSLGVQGMALSMLVSLGELSQSIQDAKKLLLSGISVKTLGFILCYVRSLDKAGVVQSFLGSSLYQIGHNSVVNNVSDHKKRVCMDILFKMGRLGESLLNNISVES